MSWQGHLNLRYRHEADRSIVHDEHSGPLRILKSLYPEGNGICHSVLVHPPGGIVGGDVLRIAAQVGENAHALITTPGATRFYRSLGATATQEIAATVAPGARLEWLPLETLAFPEAQADNRLRFELAAGAEMIGWDVLALGLPASGQPFSAGRYTQSIELPGVWLERGRVDGSDTRLLNSPLGWAGHTVLATMWFAAGSPLPNARRDALLEAAREAIAADDLRAAAGCTSPHAQLIVLRALAHRVEPAMQLLMKVRGAWRSTAWQLDANAPRVWRT